MDFSEKRQCPRRITEKVAVSVRPLDPQVWFKFWDGFDCEMRDISLVGAGLYSSEELPQGTPLSIDVRLGENAASIRIFGKIAWIQKEDNNYRVGVCFSWWKDEEDKKVIDNFVNAQVSAN